jgi:two-component system, NtrC family, nitrogen regulation sensor histidine kinase NtrY
MNLSRLSISISRWISRRRYYYIVFFVITALLVLEAVRVFVLHHVENNWETIGEERAENEALVVQSAFEKIQKRVSAIAERASYPLADHPCEASQTACFDIVRSIPVNELQGIEVYDPDGDVISWWGRIPDYSRDVFLYNHTFSRITQGNVFTTLTVIKPVHSDTGERHGVIAVHEAFDVQYTLSPRFIRMQGLQHDLRESLGKPVQLVFSTDRSESGEVRVPLYGIHDSPLGYAILAPPTLEGYIADIEESIHHVRSFLIIILSLFLFSGIISRLRHINFPFFAVLISILVVWVVRYSWMFLDIPGLLLNGPAFDPAYYASPHGGGIVASPGDLLITGLFLIFTGLLFFHSVVINNSLKIPTRLPSHHRVWVPVAALVIMLLHMGLIRAYAASVRSLVFDSSVRFTDPGSLLPSAMLALMQLNLLVLTAAFILLGTVLGYIALKIVQAGFHRSLIQSSIVLLFIICVAAFGYYLLQDNALVRVWYYLGIPLVLISITLLVQMGFLQSFRLYKIRSILFLTGLSVVFAAPVLDRMIHQFDREQIQFIANNIIRPTDAWKEFILHHSLREFSTDPELIRLMEENDQTALRQKAFHLWASSMLGREGYNATIVILDNDRIPISRFGIGFQPSDEVPVMQLIDIEEVEETYIYDIETLYGNATLYAALSNVHNDGGVLLGSIVVNVITGPGTLFRGHGPDILTTQISPDIAARYGQLVISEFKNEKLIATSAPNIPSTHTIPEHILSALYGAEDTFLWCHERIENQRYETAYFRAPDRGAGDYLAVSIPYLDFRWHIFYALKLVFFALAVSVMLLLIAGFVFYAQGKRYQPTFKEKILIGLLSLSLIPIVIVAYLNREFTIDRMTENISRQLFDEAKRVVLQLQRYSQSDEPVDFLRVSQPTVERIAGELGIDFIIYIGKNLNATSRMEMFEAELIDRRLSGFAYVSVVLQRKNFVMREEAIGQSSYLVGYLPLLDEENNVYGVLAVPAIYRQAEIDEELARRDAFLFGIYALVILGVIITGLIVANRVSRPIEKLTEATHKVAGGELDIHLEEKGDSEISNLMQSFNDMTKRLKESREELARVERELAWREMAQQVAHEIRNPLTPMKLTIQQLRQARNDRSRDFDTSFNAITRMVLEQIETLDKIASEFSRFARMPVPQFGPVNINDVLRRAIAIFPKKNGVDFHTNFDDTIPMISADPEELQRAFVNIIRNSVQAMPDGGTLEISTDLHHDEIRIVIADTGRGISPEVRSRLFEPNFSTKTDGMGLGLAIVKKTINELQGTINIISEERTGTRVIITLPIKPIPDNYSRKEIL